jgi:EAL domain-containing protein (putative c-di-GMP-specific phosphodiesterase class I)
MRLLIIDDEEDICDIIAELAERRGFEARTISDAETVQDMLSDYSPDLIMMDLMMPGIDGVELLRLLSEKARNAKLCLISGSDARVLNSARRLGSAHGLDVIAALEKPLTIQTLNNFFDTVSAQGKQGAPANHAEAIASGQFTLFYQPVVNLMTREVKGVEALARWQHPERGLLMPDEFLDQVTNDGLMQTLTEFVIKTSVRQASAWHQTGERFTLAMNVTASTLLDLALPDRIADMCKQNGVPSEMLILEVTETEAMRDVTRTMDVLLRMRLRNIGVSIDDFGTGHSSLRELQRMPFSELKIDRSFVIDMARNKDCAVIVNSIIDLGHNLGLKVIAEGIEDVRAWEMLQEKGCDYGQGYYMGRPMTAAEFDIWLTNWRKGG